MSPTKNCIELQDYSIQLGSAQSILANFLSKSDYSQIFVLVDENTHRDCLPLLALNLPENQIIKIKSGEQHKTITTCQAIWNHLLSQNAGRGALLLNLGGGVIGDMGGFCASTYKRGIDFVQIPTTLLSQVDASIGGKLGIDFGDIKNSIGLFKNPQMVIVDTHFLETLPKRQLKSGYAEVLKHALINDKAQWDFLSNQGFDSIGDWNDIVFDSLLVKKAVVEQDPFEKGYRKILNFGHTIGHAIESYSLQKDEDPLLHGEAIGLGMMVELYLSQKKLNLSESDFSEGCQYLKKNYQHYPIPNEDFGKLIALMKNDKKNIGGAINVSLLSNLGLAKENCVLEEATILEAMQFYMNNLWA